ncbi:polysaccharide deacetylase family protein [Pleionea sediminis]|uniref:polysaccharide deacetylase family protein n=1 Tax=Pleionea sediminis TaxID=2569479 RepID=UPI001184A572|nr:polysaccharide deacetylase family protein [Pleionea sediminis]
MAFLFLVDLRNLVRFITKLSIIVGITISASKATSINNSSIDNIPQQLTILLYHHISEETPRSTSTKPEEFEAHLKYLKENNFHVLNLENAIKRLFNGEPLPPKAIAITFDDGYASIFNEAWPLLKRYQMPFTIFIATEPVDNQYSSMMTWQQLNTLKEANVSIANHTRTHPHLLGLSLKEAQEEITYADMQIKKALNIQSNLFAYPYGEYNLPLSNTLQTNRLFGFAQYSGPATALSSPQAIPRFSVSGQYAKLSDFKLKVNTLAMPVTHQEKYEPHITQAKKHFSLNFESLPFAPSSIQCFYSGKLISNLNWKKSRLNIELDSPAKFGRSRINCTAPTGKNNQFYWHSLPIFREPEDKKWPD